MRDADKRPVMIVDDLPEMRAILAEVLEDAGFSTITASNGEEAWRVLAEGVAPRAILLDLVMPIMDGWQFLRAARPAAPVILMSGAVANVPADLPACVVGTLEKPVDLTTLLETLRRTVTTPLGSPRTGRRRDLGAHKHSNPRPSSKPAPSSKTTRST